jgi:hypothetical protein
MQPDGWGNLLIWAAQHCKFNMHGLHNIACRFTTVHMGRTTVNTYGRKNSASGLHNIAMDYTTGPLGCTALTPTELNAAWLIVAIIVQIHTN